MAIVFNCPQCDHPYKLKDEFAGKRATCKNPDCRQVITIPAAIDHGLRISDLGGILPEDAEKNASPAPQTPADVEAAALAALSDTVKEKEDTEAGSAIPMTCPHCDHKWTEPFAKAGKNTLCPNEECRQRIKVPEPKKGEARDNWRSTASGKPTLAKENFEKPTDVMDAEARVVSREAYVKGGGAEQDYEPVTLKRKLFVWSLIAAPILLLAGGIWGFVSWNRGRGEEVKMEPAITAFAAAREELDPVQAALGSAILELAAGEHALHPRSMDADKALELAHQSFTKSRSELQHAAQKDTANKATADRYAVASELAMAVIGLGGSDEEVKADARFRWLPDAPGNRPLRVNERRHTVHEELRLTLSLLANADFDTKSNIARRLARELAKKGQPGLAVELPVFYFSEAEMPEAKAIIALELYRQNRNAAEAPSKVADELKALLAKGAPGRIPTPASAQTLWQIVGTENAPTLYAAPGAQFSEGSRFAYTGLYLLTPNEESKALDLVRRQGGSLPGQLRALALYAEWAADPVPAFDTALAAISLSAKAKKEGPPASIMLRLVQLAAAAGKADHAKQFADLIADEGTKAWAYGCAIQFAAKPENTSRLEDTALELPPDPKKLRAGHFWGRMWQARQNARSLSASEATKLVKAWPAGTIIPFGLAGIALAQHDKK